MTSHPSPSASASPAASFWLLVLAAASVLMVTMGVRMTLGLYVAPINEATGLGIAAISFALAVAQIMWGVSQPLFGAVADRYGPGGSLFAGAAVMGVGLALRPVGARRPGQTLCLGVLVAAGAGAGSFSVLLGAVAARLPADRRAFASGFINAGGSFGQFVFAPLSQWLIAGFGWVTALFGLAALAARCMATATP
ncbi:MFS transporter [Thauera aminoaromatica]|uniref:MFS transporter n=1 Tax=Thauera aminoaromatica TaxID=164330 RepID=A0A5C7SQQ1_THASP|nr:MFS transporter [Thauera aminoaromatica]TXH85456.1 MAG: MFS transporter [Thauera aminoaromatica]